MALHARPADAPLLRITYTPNGPLRWSHYFRRDASGEITVDRHEGYTLRGVPITDAEGDALRELHWRAVRTPEENYG